MLRTARCRPGASVIAVVLVLGVLGCATAWVARGVFGVRTLEILAEDPDSEHGIGGAILAANAANEPLRIVSRLPRGTEILLSRELPWLSGRRIEILGNGIVLRDADCARADGRIGCSGLVVTGSRIIVRDIVATGFRFDGISVRGADGVSIVDSRLVANLDDGVGVSDRSKGVVIEGCVLERNGYRSKGKGILVFDHSEALLRNNRIVRNRDGVTVSNRSHAVLENNSILDSYDKGLGVTGASASGERNVISGSGAGRFEEGAGPNADGLRVTLDSSVRLERSRITGSGDCGVVVEGTSRVELAEVTMDANRRCDYRVGSDAQLVIDGTPVPRSQSRAAAIKSMTSDMMVESR
jgi:parallel beta-helix repeat protein